MIHELTGVVLAGGKSRRFGSNKALADWNGTTLVEAAAKSLLRVLPEVLVVTKDKESLGFMESGNVKIVEDLFREDHPLGGLYTGLQRIKTKYAFVCACDMPFVQLKLIEALWEAGRNADYDAVIPVWQGKRQTLSGLYSRVCSGMIRSSIDRGTLGITALCDRLRTRFYLEEEIKSEDPEGLSFLDIDTREDYERVHRIRSC